MNEIKDIPNDVAFFFQEAELDRNASWENIKAAYRKLALNYHPDRIRMDDNNPNKAKLISEYEEIFKKIASGYGYLEQMNQNKTSNTDVNKSEMPFQDEANPNALVPKDGMIKVFFPIYILKTAKPGARTFYGVSLTAAELESPARFTFLLERLNEALKYGAYQVGLDREETNKIINQHSYYKNMEISFIAALELHVHFTTLNPREGESWARPTPYFWLKKDTNISIQNVYSLSPAIKADYGYNVTEAMKALQREFIPGKEITPLITPTQPFDFYQPLNTKALISEALKHYRAEYERSIRYNTASAEILDNIIKMQALLLSDSSKQHKIEEIRKLTYSGRFGLILDAMDSYYTHLDDELEDCVAKEEKQSLLEGTSQGLLDNGDNKICEAELAESSLKEAEQPLLEETPQGLLDNGDKAKLAESLFEQYLKEKSKINVNLSPKEERVAALTLISNIVKQADTIEKLSDFYKALNALELRTPFFKYAQRNFFSKETGATPSWEKVLGEIKSQAMNLATKESQDHPVDFQNHYNLYQDIFKICDFHGPVKHDGLNALEIVRNVTSTTLSFLGWR
ncbi:molecular chaperone DnaJ [Legionella santicrucis]|uniref:Molecular chaperone DnaJ n=1 Tax=Legionella santicrucis TaxID=45074 RepID=A0A0W0YRU8_9GAMM|nr:DnaJ domain-containing protein [Legionella santicrucis]KTD59589.1 molecular chaperone DnaJ [Legionella santicrucis]